MLFLWSSATPFKDFQRKHGFSLLVHGKKLFWIWHFYKMIAFSLNLFGSQNPYFWFIHICKKYLICSLKQLFMLMMIQECMVFLFLVLMVVGVCSLCWCLWWWWCLLCSVTQSVWCLWCQTLVRLSLPVNLPGSTTGAILTLRPCLLTFTLVCSHRWLLNLILDTCFIIDFGHTFLFCFFHFFVFV